MTMIQDRTGTRKPQLMELPVSKLKVDLFNADEATHGYQRDPDARFRKLVDKMKTEFLPDLFNPLSVAEWKGEYFVYDGNARRMCAEEVAAEPSAAVLFPEAAAFFGSDPLLECRVSFDCPPNRQAFLFVKCNEDRRGVPWLNRHHANLYQGDAVALTIEEVCAQLGIGIGKGHGNVSAVQALYSTVQYDGRQAPARRDLLIDVLHVANQSWMVGRANRADTQYAFSDRTLDALSLLFDTFSAIDLPRDEAIASFRKVLARDLVNRAAKATSAHGSNNATALAKEMLKQYNARDENHPMGHALRYSRLDPAKKRAKKRQAKSRKS